ncbi:uncharacterized protein LOC121390730 [Gigantopelta aegis]|uniref:uncharacterized protein LOC121390730 n=1 Tax=Gigantopelta aegis TaxID=1735272 RepID=UPI001B88BF6C|nr:uncharacterized protein LOC121390730 [Gigantopelta aegis]
MESGSVGAGALTKSKIQDSSRDGGKHQVKLPQSDRKLPPSEDISNIKENVNNNASLSCDPDYGEDASEAHYQDSASARINDDVPVEVREEAVHDDVQMQSHNVEDASHPSNNGRSSVTEAQGNHVTTTITTTTKKSKQCLQVDVGGCGDHRDTNSTSKEKSVTRKIIKEENVCDELPVYNDIAMDPSPNYQNNATNSTQHPADNRTKSHCRETKILIQNRQALEEQEKIDNENTQILLVYVDETSNESVLMVDENNTQTKEDNKTAMSTSNLVETVIVKNEQSTEDSLKKTIVKDETIDSAPSCNLKTARPTEHKQMEICDTDDSRRNGNIADNVVSERNAPRCSPRTSAVKINGGAGDVKSVIPVEPAATYGKKQTTNGQQVLRVSSSNKPLESDVFKEPSTCSQLKQPTLDGTRRQNGENVIMGSDNNNNSSRVAKSETVISQFNMFPTEKDVMAAVYQNTAETSHLTGNCGLMNSQSSSTSVVSTHSGCSSYIPSDLQPNSSYPEAQSSHSKWFANQVNLAAALCVANNSSYQDVHGSSPLIPQRSPQQRNVFSPSYQKDFSQFVLQSPKPNVHGNQNISPSMLCSPSTNLFETLMYQSENPFSPSASRSDTGRNYSNVQDLDELMSAQQAYQPRQPPCFMNTSAHSTSQQANRSQDVNWNSMNQPATLPGVASLLPSSSVHHAEGRPSSSSAGHTPYNTRDRYASNSVLPSMSNVAVEHVRPQKDTNSLIACNSNVVIEEYTATQYQEILQRPELGHGHGNRNWNAAPHEDRDCQGRPNQHKTRPRKQNISESSSAPHLASKQSSSGKGTKRSHSNTDHSASVTSSSTKKACHSPTEEDSKGYVNYQIASTIHTLKPRHIVSWYIDFLIKENENITDMSHSYSIPAGIFDDRDFYFMESLLKRMSFPTKKFANWMQVNFPSININAIDFSEGRRRQQNFIIDEAKYWSERTQVDIINEVFYHFQSVRDQK